MTRDLTMSVGALLIVMSVFDESGSDGVGEAAAPVEMAKSIRAMLGRYIVWSNRCSSWSFSRRGDDLMGSEGLGADLLAVSRP